MSDLPKLYRMDEIAGMLQVSKRWLQYHLEGRAIGVKVGRRRMFTAADAQQIIDELPRVQPLRFAGPVRQGGRFQPQLTASEFIRERKGKQGSKALDEALRLAGEKPARKRR